MKARSFFIALIASLLVFLLATLGFGFAMVFHSPLRAADFRSLQLPRAAEYVSRDSLLTLHWFMEPSSLPAYAEAVVAPKRRNDAREAIKRLRDGSFSLAGIDFDSELQDWLGSDISLTILEPEGEQEPLGWLLALSSRNKGGAKEFLEAFWKKRSLEEKDLDINTYKDKELTTLQSPLNGKNQQPISSTLVDENLALITSRRSVLEQAIDVSELPERQQLRDQELISSLENLHNANAIVIASPKALTPLLQFPLSFSEKGAIKELVAGIRIDGSELILEGKLPFDRPSNEFNIPSIDIIPLLEEAGGPAEIIGVSSTPKLLFDSNKESLDYKLIGSKLLPELNRENNLSLKTIQSIDKGPIIWLQEPKGWVIGMEPSNTLVSDIDEALVKEGMFQSDVSSEEDNLKVWTKFSTKFRQGERILDTQLALALEESSDYSWWGETIAALQQRKQHNDLEPLLKQLKAISRSDENSFTELIALGANPTREQLESWAPWKLLQALAGRSFRSSVQGGVIAMGAFDKGEEISGLLLLARLTLG